MTIKLGVFNKMTFIAFISRVAWWSGKLPYVYAGMQITPYVALLSYAWVLKPMANKAAKASVRAASGAFTWVLSFVDQLNGQTSFYT